MGPLLREETLFIFLEGMLITISVFALNLGHPGMLPPPSIDQIAPLDLDDHRDEKIDLEKTLPEIYLTPASEKEYGFRKRDSQENLVYRDPPVHRRSGIRDLLSPKRPLGLHGNSPLSTPNSMAVERDSMDDRRYSSQSLSDIYGLYNGKGNGSSEWTNGGGPNKVPGGELTSISFGSRGNRDIRLEFANPTSGEKNRHSRVRYLLYHVTLHATACFQLFRIPLSRRLSTLCVCAF